MTRPHKFANFYRRAGTAAALLLLLCIGILFAGFEASHRALRLDMHIKPEDRENVLLKAQTVPAVPQGKTQSQVTHEGSQVNFDFFLDPSQDLPYAHYAQYVVDETGSSEPLDLTPYQTISFDVACAPKNVLMFVIFSVDDRVTNLRDLKTSRVSSFPFTCVQRKQRVNVPLDRLETPHWWLSQHGYDYSDTGYRRDRVIGIAWVTTFQSPANELSTARIKGVTLAGVVPLYRYGAIAICCFLWLVFFARQYRSYLALLFSDSGDLSVNASQDCGSINSLCAPELQQRIAKRRKSKETDAVMKYMEAEYKQPHLGLEMAATALGMNRNKINEILKEEVGVTFSAYLNRLRLTEAVRQLADGGRSVSEVAYSVGYNNVSYFNKLFKETYGCAPTRFKEQAKPDEPALPI